MSTIKPKMYTFSVTLKINQHEVTRSETMHDVYDCKVTKLLSDQFKGGFQLLFDAAELGMMEDMFASTSELIYEAPALVPKS